MEPNRETLAITVDKSHLITIGEKLYTQSIELIRELVNNAYDADASVVEVEITEDRIVIKDNGSGMDLKGLKQYFNIGSPEKKYHPKSPKFKRDRIGQFGIGKFATLSACGSFTVSTQSRDFAAEVVFDKEEWGESEDNWHLPMTTLSYEASRGDGTTITLSKLTKKFNIEDVEERLIEGVPIRDKDFAVYLNGKRVMSRELPGRRFPVIEGTPYGPIHGEIVILPSAQTTTSEPLGIECKVKQVTVKREYFGMDTWGRDMARVRGLIYADFLPVTTDRSGFIVDSEEYKAFYGAMLKVMEDVKAYL
ncbi:MAG: ATP-binding protein [Nitrospirae bacterium]|nr:ATP-binding protein [Nitrospirota bacterium]